jgi:hypothetical protein
MNGPVARTLVACLALAAAEAASGAGLPLPEAPVRLVIPDAAAFDAALTGAFRAALVGRPDTSDPVVAAWRRTPVGSKLEAQWGSFASELPWSWDEIRALQPRSVGVALLSVGALEAVLVIESPLAALPASLPALPDGEAKTHAGAPYRLVAAGAGDDGAPPGRRLGLAWARQGGRLLLATSERALKLVIDEDLAGRSVEPPLPGLASLELDLDALRKDLYFRREFLFGEGPERGRIRAALRREGGTFVEVREGEGPGAADAMSFDARGAAASGWEPDASGLWNALRAALLEPIPVRSDRPVPPARPLPPHEQRAEDPYLVSLDVPLGKEGPAGEEGELGRWRALWAKHSPSGWGYWITADGARRLVFPWPAALQAELEALCRATLERTSGRVEVADVSGARELRVGPGLPVLALRRAGEIVWIGPAASALADAPVPRTAPAILRWARADLAAARGEAPRWRRAEGPAAPERVRPFSDRVFGLLGWMPSTRTIEVERRRTEEGWSERVVFSPSASP